MGRSSLAAARRPPCAPPPQGKARTTPRADRHRWAPAVLCPF
jgi:hypothetical protein